MDEKEYFKLRLEGLQFKAVLNEWYYKRPDTAYDLSELIIVGEDGIGTVSIPPHVVREKHYINEKMIIFLKNNTCYELGTYKTHHND